MSRRLIGGLAFALICPVVISTGLCVVPPGEQIVVRRFGKVLRPAWGTGLHWHWPLGIDRLDRIRIDEVRRLDIGQDLSLEEDPAAKAGEYLTGDLNLVRIRAMIQFRVDDPANYVARAGSDGAILGRFAEGQLSALLSRRTIDHILRTGRRELARELERDLQTAAVSRKLGVAILGVSFTDARPPAEVAPDFAESQAAESRRDGRIVEAKTRAERVEKLAMAEARTLLDLAHAELERKLVTSRAEASRFRALVQEIKKDRTLSIRRIYLESMAGFLERVHKKLVVPAGDAIDLTVLGVDP